MTAAQYFAYFRTKLQSDKVYANVPDYCKPPFIKFLEWMETRLAYASPSKLEDIIGDAMFEYTVYTAKKSTRTDPISLPTLQRWNKSIDRCMRACRFLNQGCFYTKDLETRIINWARAREMPGPDEEWRLPINSDRLTDISVRAEACRYFPYIYASRALALLYAGVARGQDFFYTKARSSSEYAAVRRPARLKDACMRRVPHALPSNPDMNGDRCVYIALPFTKTGVRSKSGNRMWISRNHKNSFYDWIQFTLEWFFNGMKWRDIIAFYPPDTPICPDFRDPTKQAHMPLNDLRRLVRQMCIEFYGDVDGKKYLTHGPRKGAVDSAFL